MDHREVGDQLVEDHLAEDQLMEGDHLVDQRGEEAEVQDPWADQK